MSLQTRIEELSPMRDSERLANDIVSAISSHFAIPEEDIVKVLEDAL